MKKIVYTLKKKKNSEELHIFKASPSIDNNCAPEKESICKKMDKSDSSENIFSCQDDNYTRNQCAKIGRQICGTCISHLYETYD